jgi:hypothetical protein
MYPLDLSRRRRAGAAHSPSPSTGPHGTPSSLAPADPPAPTQDGIPVLSAAAAIGYAVETLRSLLSHQLNPHTNAVLTLLEERSAQIQRDLPDILRAARYLADGRRGIPKADGTLADALRAELDSLPLAQARCIHPRGWNHGRRPVPLRVARDALRPILDVALATGRRRVLVQFHRDESKGPWMTISWCLRAASRSRDASGTALKSGETAGFPPPLAELAASQLGCAWRPFASPARRVRLDLGPHPTHDKPATPGASQSQAGPRVRAKATSPRAVKKAFAKSNSVPKR